jgi:hypothetical protein
VLEMCEYQSGVDEFADLLGAGSDVLRGASGLQEREPRLGRAAEVIA